jgi:hypothetical protein
MRRSFLCKVLKNMGCTGVPDPLKIYILVHSNRNNPLTPLPAGAGGIREARHSWLYHLLEKLPRGDRARD